MNAPPSRLCPNCGAPVAGDGPCAACALAGAFASLGFQEPPPDSDAPRFSPLDLPSTFKHYRVVREIAAGGMGMVYEAWDTRLGRSIALKMLRQVFFSTEAERLRFQSEAELASRLDHPGIVPIYEVGVHEGQPYFTMKLIRGSNLADRLAAGSLTPRAAAELMAPMARAVQHAHQRGIIHRDLKPANILLDETGRPWLADFGVAKWLEVNSGLTNTQSLIGTPDFMSPEQAAGRRGEISTATDVWALGVMFYLMVTGRLPFQGGSHPEVLRQVADREPLTPRAVISHLDRDLETLCLRCLDKDPARRLASAGELADELQRWLDGEPIRARRITDLERLGKWTRRHPYRAAFAGGFVGVVLLAVGLVAWQWRRATANEHRALDSAAAERRTAYSAVLAQALAAREHHDLGEARRLLLSIDPSLRGFGWRLLRHLCRGDERLAWRLGEGPGAEPQCLALIHGQRHLAVLSADGRLHLHDLQGTALASPRALPPLPNGTSQARHYRGLSFSPGGQRLAYTCGDVIQVLDSDSFAVLYEETSRLPQCGWLDDDRLLLGFNGSVATPPWPGAGAWILTFGKDPHGAPTIDRLPLPEMCAPLAVSPDRRFFVLQRVHAQPEAWGRTLHLYRAKDDFTTIPEPLYTLPGVEYPGTLAFSSFGEYLALSAGPTLRQTARVLRAATGQVVFDCDFRFPIHALAFDQDETRLGLVGGDSVVRIYDFARTRPDGSPGDTYDDDVDSSRRQSVNGPEAHAPPSDLITRTAQQGRARFYFGHEKQVSDLVFEPTGALISASADGTLRNWPVGIPQPAVRIGRIETSYPLYHPAASADGLRILFLQDSVARIRDAGRSQATLGNVLLPAASAHAPLAVLADGRVLTQDRNSGEVVAWVQEGGKPLLQKRLPAATPPPNTGTGRTRRGVLSADEKRLVGAYEGRIFTVDLGQGTVTWSGDLGRRHGAYLGLGVTGYANHDLSPDGQWIATSDFGSRVTILSFAAPQTIVATLGHQTRDNDTAVVFSRDGHWLFTGNEDGRVRVWDTATWQERADLGWPAHRSAVTALAVSHDGTLIATSGDETLKLFPAQPEPGQPDRRERLSFQLLQSANWIQFARDAQGRDRALLHSVPDGTLQVWDADAPGDPNDPSAE